MLVGQLIMRISVMFMLQYNSVPLKKAVIPVYHGKKKNVIPLFVILVFIVNFYVGRPLEMHEFMQ